MTPKYPTLLFCLAATFLIHCDDSHQAPTSWELLSPNGVLQLFISHENRSGELDYPDATALYYSLTHNGTTVIESSPLGFILENERKEENLLTNLSYVSENKESQNATYTMLVGKRSERSYEYNEQKIKFKSESGTTLTLEFRAFDDGVAIRSRLDGDGERMILQEATGFRIPKESYGLMTPYDVGGAIFAGTYEQLPQNVSVGDIANASGWAFPALFQIGTGENWVLITEADLTPQYSATRLHEEPVDNLYRIRFPRWNEGDLYNDEFPSGPLPITSPWRVIIAGNLNTIVASTLVDDVSSPSKTSTTNWIRPGRSSWSWFSQGTGGLSLQREYVDFSAEMGWEHILIDEGWTRWSDYETVIPALAQEAKEKDVGILLWYNSGGDHTINQGKPRDRLLDTESRRTEFAMLQSWGISGIKVDFFESDKQDRIKQYIGILEDALDHELLVNFHGATLPKGWQRTYPNLMTHEAVRGAEYYDTPADGPSALDDVHYVFTRNVVGSMDYTPVTFSSAHETVGVTYAHELALSVAFESGLQHYADRADSNPNHGYREIFAENPIVKEVLKMVPTTWDDTLLLDGDPRSHVVLARRKGESWFLGGLNGLEQTKALNLSLSFLANGNYELTLVQSGETATSFKSQVQVVSAQDQLTTSLVGLDGFVAILKPAAK